jgi:hypothetical protein
MSAADLFDGFWGAVVGGVIGALGTGSAQIWSFRRGVKTSRVDQSHRAAAELLEVLHTCDQTLPMLPHTDSAPGSPLSYGERGDIARPMLEALDHAGFVIVPLLTDATLTARFERFEELCRHAASPNVDAQDIHHAVKGVREYGRHVRECLTTHLDDKPMPPEPPDVISLENQ